MIGSGNVVSIGSTGISDFPNDVYAVYEAQIKSYLEGLNYDTFGEGDRRAELRVFKFQNISTQMSNSLQNTIKELLLVRFPEIEYVNITSFHQDQGTLMFTLNWKLLDEVMETDINI